MELITPSPYDILAGDFITFEMLDEYPPYDPIRIRARVHDMRKGSRTELVAAGHAITNKWGDLLSDWTSGEITLISIERGR